MDTSVLIWDTWRIRARKYRRIEHLVRWKHVLRKNKIKELLQLKKKSSKQTLKLTVQFVTDHNNTAFPQN